MGVELCQVQVRHYEFKCQDSEHFDADNMLGEPHMRGVKRKFNAESDERIFSDIVCSHQRQSIFNLSMCKLTRFRQNPEPSLLRSVLIFNTLRSIERDMDKDGLKLNCCFNSTLFPTSQNGATLSSTTTTFCPDSSHNPSFFYNINSSNSSHSTPMSELASSEENYFYNNNCISNNLNGSSTSDNETKCRPIVELENLSSGRITPFTRSVYDRVDAGALWNDDTDRLTSLNWSSVLNFNFSSNSQTSNGSNGNLNFDSNKNHFPESSETCLHTLMPPSQGNLNSTLTTLSNCINPLLNNGNVIGSISSLNNGTEEIFGDIDLSLYDFDVLSPLSPPNVKLAPVSAEELMKSLSGNNEATHVSLTKGNIQSGDTNCDYNTEDIDKLKDR